MDRLAPILIANPMTFQKQDFKQSQEEAADYIETISLPLPTPDTTTISSPTIHALRIHNQRTSPLLRLPRELRDLITTSYLTSHSTPHSSTSPTTLPALLQTCHSLRPEVAKLYYSTHLLLLAAGAPSPHYEKNLFNGFDPDHKRFVRRVHWKWDAYGTREMAMSRARELDALTGMREGVWTVGFIDVFEMDDGEESQEEEREEQRVGRRKRRATCVNSQGRVQEPGNCG